MRAIFQSSSDPRFVCARRAFDLCDVTACASPALTIAAVACVCQDVIRTMVTFLKHHRRVRLLREQVRLTKRESRSPHAMSAPPGVLVASVAAAVASSSGAPDSPSSVIASGVTPSATDAAAAALPAAPVQDIGDSCDTSDLTLSDSEAEP